MDTILFVGKDRIKVVRLAAYEAGIDVAVLSHTTPGVQSLPLDQAVPMGSQANDVIANLVRERPDRFQGLVTLPTTAPKDAAHELERAIKELSLDGAMLFGRTGDRNLDHSDFWPILGKRSINHTLSADAEVRQRSGYAGSSAMFQGSSAS